MLIQTVIQLLECGKLFKVNSPVQFLHYKIAVIPPVLTDSCEDNGANVCQYALQSQKAGTQQIIITILNKKSLVTISLIAWKEWI